MKCDSQASLLARTFASPCFGHEPKARVVTTLMKTNVNYCKLKIEKDFLNVEHNKFQRDYKNMKKKKKI
jgi:hypothetical protein